jgi:tetratricopeptide (TPR) repeat protein
MISARDIEQALLSRLSHEHRGSISGLAKLLAEVVNGSLGFDKANQAAGSEYEELLRILAGQTILFGTTQMTFEQAAGRSNVSIRQAAGGIQNETIEFTLGVSGSRNIIVERDVINSVIANVDLVFPQYFKSEPVDPHTLEAAQRLLNDLPLELIPEPGTLPERSRMPFRRNKLFVGRENDLRWLARQLRGETTAARMPLVSISGIGGIGKSQLATEFIHRYGRFFAGNVFWLNFINPDAVAAEVIACGGPEGLDLPNFSFLSVEHQLQKVLSAWQSPLPRLLVFDNCEEDELLDKWLPTTGGCRVLVTSRRYEWDPSLGVQVLQLDVFRRGESVELLRKFREDLPATDPDLDAIANELGDLPLALYLAGSYLKLYKHETTPAKYLLQLRGPPLLRHPSLMNGGLSPTRHIQNVARTFDLSYMRLNPTDVEHALALQILPRAAHFAPGTPIPRHLLRETVDLNDNDDARLRATKPLKHLLDLGLLEENDAEGALRMHRLLGEFVRDTVDAPVEAAARKAVEIVILTTIYFPEGFGYQDTLLPLQAHIRTVVDKAFECYFEAQDYHSAISAQLSVDRLLEKWGAYRHLLTQHERVRDKLTDPWFKSRSLLHVGSALTNLGKTREAIPYAKQALEFARQSGERIDQAAALDLLGRCHWALGEVDEALGKFIQSLNLGAGLQPRNMNVEAKTTLNLGLCYYELGLMRQAIRQTESALNIARQLADRGVARELLILCDLSLGQCHFMQGQTSEAIEKCQRVLADIRGELRVEATCLGNLSEYFTALAQFERAHEYLAQALSKCAEFGLKREESHVLHTLAELLIDEGKLDRAVEVATEGVKAGQAAGKPQLVSDSRNALARAYLFLSEFPAARTAAAGALEYGTALNRHYASALMGLAALRLGDSTEATEKLKLAVREADALIKNDSSNYRALDTRCVALRGLTLLEDYNYQSEASAAHKAAREINNDIGVARRILRLLEVINAGDR